MEGEKGKKEREGEKGMKRGKGKDAEREGREGETLIMTRRKKGRGDM